MMHNQVATSSETLCARHWLSTRRHYPVWRPKLHLCSKSLNIYLKQGCVAETRHQFLFVFTETG